MTAGVVAGWWKREEMERKRGNLAVLARRTGQRPVWAERNAASAWKGRLWDALRPVVKALSGAAFS